MGAQASDSGSGSAVPGPNDGSDSQRRAGKGSHRWRSRFANIIKLPWFVGIVSGVISGAMVTFAVTATGHSTGVRIFELAQLAAPPSCTDPGWLLQVPDDQILANSWYAALDTLRYHGTLHTPDLTVDGNVRTAWLQWWPTKGLSNNTFSGNYISWSFAQPYDIRLVCILNGWEEDSTTFNSVEPVKSATMGYTTPGCTGTRVNLRTHTYTYMWNQVELSYSHSTRELCLQIRRPYPRRAKLLDCVPGPKGHERPCRTLTGLSEVRFYYSPALLNWVPY
jgi:hypothetical protein